MNGVYIDLDEELISSISENIMTDELRSHGYYINKIPRLELIPPYSADVDIELPTNLTPYRIEVKGLDLEPSMEKPMRVILDLSNDMTIQLWRDEILNQISEDDLIREPQPLRTAIINNSVGDTSELNITPSIRDDLIRIVDSYSIPQYIKGTNLRIDNADVNDSVR